MDIDNIKAELISYDKECNNDEHTQRIIIAQAEENILQITKRRLLLQRVDQIINKLTEDKKPKHLKED